MSVYKLDNGKIEPLKEEETKPLKKMTGAEIIKQDVEEQVASVKEMATETGKADSETEKADSGTAEAASVDDLYVKKNGRYGSPKPQPKTDWVEEAYKCFIKDAGDIDPTDPISAIAHYFAKNATPELKARCEKEGKNATGCWKFIEAVARKALHGSSGHIDPGVVYAIAMHWFEDVPKDWDAASAKASASAKATADKTARQAKPAKTAKSKKPAETPSEIKKEKAKAKAKAAKASASAAKPLRRDKKKPKQSQGFFFEMLETPVITPEKESEVQG